MVKVIIRKCVSIVIWGLCSRLILSAPESRQTVFAVDFEKVFSILNALNSSFPCGRKASVMLIICIFFYSIDFGKYRQSKNSKDKTEIDKKARQVALKKQHFLK